MPHLLNPNDERHPATTKVARKDREDLAQKRRQKKKDMPGSPGTERPICLIDFHLHESRKVAKIKINGNLLDHTICNEHGYINYGAQSASRAAIP